MMICMCMAAVLVWDYSRKKQTGGLRIWNFQGYQRNSRWNSQGLIKNNVGFPEMNKEKLCGISSGFGFRPENTDKKNRIATISHTNYSDQLMLKLFNMYYGLSMLTKHFLHLDADSASWWMHPMELFGNVLPYLYRYIKNTIKTKVNK